MFSQLHLVKVTKARDTAGQRKYKRAKNAGQHLREKRAKKPVSEKKAREKSRSASQGKNRAVWSEVKWREVSCIFTVKNAREKAFDVHRVA